MLSADERKLREMCCALKKVEAPKDFEFKVKARIAQAQPRDYEPRFGFAFRYGLPALALIVVFGLFFYNGGLLSPGNNQMAAGSTIVSPDPALPQNAAVSRFTSPEEQEPATSSPAVQNQEPSRTFEKAPAPQIAEILPQKTEKIGRQEKKDLGDGSKVFSSTEGKPKQPRVIELSNSQNIEQNNPIALKGIFSTFGINAAFENGKWTVKSVNGNNLGLKENDVIEAIDDKPLGTEFISSKFVSAKTFTVNRNGEKFVIKLQNK